MMDADLERQLRSEARQKMLDERYPPSLKLWLRETLLEVYSKKAPETEVRRVLDEVWEVYPDEVEGWQP